MRSRRSIGCMNCDFDPQLIPVFHEVLPEILDIKERYDEPVACSKFDPTQQ